MIKKVTNKLQSYLNLLINNKDPIIAKIDKLELFIIRHKFNPYLLATDLEVIHSDIILYTEAITNILAQDLSENYIKIKPIDRNSLLTVHIGTFWTNQNNLLTNTNVAFKNWLTASKELINRYNVNIKLVGSGMGYSNAVKLQPYITNIRSIIDILESEIIGS